jgi:hypothetical protein
VENYRDVIESLKEKEKAESAKETGAYLIKTQFFSTNFFDSSLSFALSSLAILDAIIAGQRNSELVVCAALMGCDCG